MDTSAFTGSIAFMMYSKSPKIQEPALKRGKALLELDSCPETKHNGTLKTSGDICVVLHHRLQR